MLENYMKNANILMDMCEIYGEAEKRNGLETNILNSMEAKAELENIFSKHPAYNGKGQIVLPCEIEKPVDETIVEDYAEYIIHIGRKYFVKYEEARIDGLTYEETYKIKERLYRYVNAINYMGLSDEDVLIKGKPFSEYREEYDKVYDTLHKFKTTCYMYDLDKYTYKEEKDRVDKLMEKVFAIADLIRDCIGKTLENENSIAAFAEKFPRVQARKGAKITKVVLKALKEIGLYELAMDSEMETFNKRYSHWCDGISTQRIKKWFIISINPVDYLSMSIGKKWTSCLNVDKLLKIVSGHFSGGFNSRRTLDYMLDPSTFVVYTVDENYEGTDWELQPKLTRQLFHYGQGKLIQSRLYPQDDVAARSLYTQYREIVEKVIADSLGEANLWSAPIRGTIGQGVVMETPYVYSCNADYIDFYDGACHASWENDFQSEVNYVVFRGSTNATENSIPMLIGSTKAVCMCCGGELGEDFSKAITCRYCFEDNTGEDLY